LATLPNHLQHGSGMEAKMKCCNQDCNQGKDCPIRKQMEEEFSLMHDIKIASLVMVLTVALVVLMAFFM
jgi:hypothetical protein